MSGKDSKKPPLQARSRETVKSILEATTRILGNDGLAKLSTNRIAEVAGVSVGSLYQFFKNKDSILAELLYASIETNFQNIFQALEKEGERRDVRLLVTALINAAFENFLRKGNIQRLLIEHAPRIFELEHVRKVDERIGPVLVRHIKESGIRIRPADPELAVFVLLQAIRGLILGSFVHRKSSEEIERIRFEFIELCTAYLEPAKEA